MGQTESIPINSSPLQITNQLSQTIMGAFSCGPECQQEQINTKLLTQYQNAQIDMLNDQEKLGYTANNYYSYVKGDVSSKAFKEANLHAVSQKMADKYSSDFSDLLNATSSLNSVYKSDVINISHANELYDSYLQKNKELSAELDNTLSDVATNDRKSYYEDQQLSGLNRWHRFYLIIYYIILVTYIICFFFIESPVGFYRRILIFGFLIFYLFFAKNLVVWVFKLLNYLISFIPKNVYLQI